MATKFLLVLAVGALAAVVCAEEELYSDKYDFIDVTGILKNDRLRNQYQACFMETAPCLTPDAIFFRDNLPEALVTKCRKCTKRQKVMFEQIVTYYTENEPEVWTQFIRKAIQRYQKKTL